MMRNERVTRRRGSRRGTKACIYQRSELGVSRSVGYREIHELLVNSIMRYLKELGSLCQYFYLFFYTKS